MKNELMLAKEDSLRMTTLEIAERTGKKHKNVIRDVENMLTELYGADFKENFTGLKFETSEINGWAKENYKDPTGRKCKMYELDQRHTMTLISGYSILLRDRIICRWKELEDAEINRRRNMTEVEKAEEKVKEAQRMLDLARRVEALQTKIDTSAVFPMTAPADFNSNRISLIEIKDKYCPFIPVGRISMILTYYGIETGIFTNQKNMSIEMFKDEGIEDVIGLFVSEAECQISNSSKGIVVSQWLRDS
jgi:phage regulator Rha-like protein